MIKLNKDQAFAVKDMKEWWRSQYNFYILRGRAGTGKCQPLDEVVITPSGLSTVEQIKEGDFLIDAEGNPTKVLKVFEHKNVNMYKLTFSDGSTTNCCEDHLWEVQTEKRRFNRTSCVLSLKEMLYYIQRPKKKKKTYYYSIPLTSPVQFEEKKYNINSYELGYILGNGSSSSEKYTDSLTVYAHVLDRYNILKYFREEYISNIQRHQENCFRFTLNKEFRSYYNLLGLKSVKSISKFIPKDYKFGSVQQRKDLLAGLLDSDGTCNNNKLRFSSSSKQLIEDVQDLIRSLGGKATLYFQERDGKKNIEYTLQIRTPFNPFKLPRKADNYKVIGWDFNKAIVSAEYIGKQDGNCFLVDNKDHLYLTRDYTVTHNTFVIDHVLDAIKPKVLLLAPTHQAKKQLEFSTKGKYLVKTVDSALGIRPTTHKEDLKFEQVGSLRLFDDYELVGVDEAGMLDDWRIDLLVSIGIKMFFLGHESQLPPIKENKKNDDLCISPIFEKQYPSCKLTIPERNTGHGFDFCNKLEEFIYEEGDPEIPNDFDVSRDFLYNYVNSEEGKDDFLKNKTKIVCWTNHHVDLISYRVRKSIFGDKINKVPFVMGDKLITSSPVNIIPDFLKKKDSQIFNLMNKKDLEVLYTNEGLEVKYFSEEMVKLNPDLYISVYKVACEWEGKFVFIYVLMNPGDYQQIREYYFRRSWNYHGKDKVRKLQEMHFILSCFAQVKFFYAATAHRLQGSTWGKVIVFNQDISKNPCVVERKKMRYVAASRHKDELMFFRGNV